MSMKKMLFFAAVAAGLWACDTNKDNATTTVTETSTNTANASGTYTPANGDVSYRDGKLMVWRDNDWAEANDDVDLDNGVVVHKNGTVERDNEVVELNDGEVVDRSGRFFDKAGNAIENAWNDTKDAVKKGANEVQEEIRDIKTDKDKD